MLLRLLWNSEEAILFLLFLLLIPSPLFSSVLSQSPEDLTLQVLAVVAFSALPLTHIPWCKKTALTSKRTRVVHYETKYGWPQPENTDLSYANSTFRCGHGFMNFFFFLSNRTKKVINQGTFQIHRWKYEAGRLHESSFLGILLVGGS